MRVIITPTELARTTFPEEKFEVVEVAGATVKLSTIVDLTDAQHASLFAASFPHPENGLPCKYFSVQVVTTPDPVSVSLASAVVDDVKLYAAVYANLLSTLGESIHPSDAVTAATAVYSRIKEDHARIPVNPENDA